MTRRGWILAGLGALLAGGCGYVVANREKTRLRLSYPPGEIETTKNVVYVTGSKNPKHRLDVFAPKGASGTPVVHFIHGGYWVEGDKDYYAATTGLYASIGTTLAKRGVLTVIQSYRLSPEVGIDGILDDVMAGLKWTQEHAKEHGGDPAKLHVMGHSAGGHLTALIGLDDSLHEKRGMRPGAVRGYVPLSAVWDVADMAEAHDARWNEQVTFGVFGRDKKGWAERSPMGRIQSGSVAKDRRWLIVAGEKDFPYLIPQAEKAHEAMKAKGANVDYRVVPGNDHIAMVLKFGAKGDNMTEMIVGFVSE